MSLWEPGTKEKEKWVREEAERRVFPNICDIVCLAADLRVGLVLLCNEWAQLVSVLSEVQLEISPGPGTLGRSIQKDCA